MTFEMQTVRNKEIVDYFMNYFDYYGFGMVMTMFFNKLYPMNMFFNKLYPTNNPERTLHRENVSNQEIIESFRTMCEDDISESQIVAFYDMRVLLITMCDFSRKNRPEPDNVFEEMGQIMYKMTGTHDDFDFSNENENENDYSNENENENENENGSTQISNAQTQKRKRKSTKSKATNQTAKSSKKRK